MKHSDHKVLNYTANDPNRHGGENWITMSNGLTRAAQGLTMAEKRIIALAISKLDSRSPRPSSERDIPITKITALEYSELFDVDTHTAYDQLKASAKHLYNRTITFFEPSERRKGKSLSLTEINMRWVGEINYNKGKGEIEIYWWPRLFAHLSGLKKQFTTYQLKQATALRSIYSWRLLELLTRFKNSGEAKYTIEDFCKSMDATPKQAANFSNIRRRIIEPAVKELIEKDGWLIEWDTITHGRKVKEVVFKFSRNPQGDLFR